MRSKKFCTIVFQKFPDGDVYSDLLILGNDATRKEFWGVG